MQRREFITLLGGAVAVWPRAARAQDKGARRVGVLMNLAGSDPEGQALIAAFQQRIRELGWIEGRNIKLEVRWTVGSPDHARAFAAELVGMKPDVIFANGGTALAALLKETRSVPVVFVGDTDPVAAGFVASLAHPGGNATGFTAFEPALGPKWLQMLKEIMPGVARVLILSADNPQAAVTLPTIEAALPSFGVQATFARIHDTAEIERAIDDAARAPNVGMVVLASTIAAVHRDVLIARAARHRLPAIYTNVLYAKSGGLLSYGVDRIDQMRQAGGYVDRVLRGEKPANLPVQTPTKIELIVNLKTSKALGIDIPATLLARADEVIE